jgi:hypothetical protein
MTVTLADASALATLEIVQELEAQGIMRDTDFTFAYHHYTVNDQGGILSRGYWTQD